MSVCSVWVGYKCSGLWFKEMKLNKRFVINFFVSFFKFYIRAKIKPKIKDKKEKENSYSPFNIFSSLTDSSRCISTSGLGTVERQLYRITSCSKEDHHLHRQLLIIVKLISVLMHGYVRIYYILVECHISSL